MGHDDTIDALAYACKYSGPILGLRENEDKDNFRYYKNNPKPKSWVIA